MFETVQTTRFIRRMGTGRTQPTLLECAREDGDSVEVVVKGAGQTMRGTHDLAVEALCAMLARDLELPVPEFFAVDVTQEFVDTVPDAVAQSALRTSIGVAFGSLLLTGGYAVWPRSHPVPATLCEAAAEIFAFDAIVINGDRRPENPNCLFSGTRLAIIDHELCFGQELFWRAPWEPGGFDTRSAPEKHIFAKPWLTECPANLDAFAQRWRALTDMRITEYFQALPNSWILNTADAVRIRDLVRCARDHIEEVIQYALEALR